MCEPLKEKDTVCGREARRAGGARDGQEGLGDPFALKEFGFYAKCRESSH